MRLINRLAQNIRELRLANGWSQDDLAEASGLDRTYISGIERGRRNPTILVVERIANGLHVDPSMLLSTECQSAENQKTLPTNRKAD
ncbi:MAG: helix-turn-helix transcriptional regulator [Geothrix sp.]|nr:helix-turn-helix transcriptional regulator [Geothrix sp.]NWJ42008.1 helix-turn-helix transcriptional regulator [Geothrix sp.]WIL20023.1 MAG: helix-turn-helix domain-containing protein [Geothrix sp.]